MNNYEINPIWYKGKDGRWNFDNVKANELMKTVPVYWEDVCPVCGNKEGINGCRCPKNCRTCPKCKANWYWKINKMCGKLIVDITKGGV